MITSDTAQAASLKNLYGDVNNIDLWIGILSEKHLSGTSVGLTMQQILKAQFEHLRDGDFYFYLNDPYLPVLLRNQLSKTRLSDIIKRNTTLTSLQSNVFFTQECPGDEEESAVGDSLSPTIEKDSRTETRIFPNPANSIIHVDFGSLTGDIYVRIYNTNSELLKTQHTISVTAGVEINIGELPGGIYFVSISNGKETKTMKLVKTRN